MMIVTRLTKTMSREKIDRVQHSLQKVAAIRLPTVESTNVNIAAENLRILRHWVDIKMHTRKNGNRQSEHRFRRAEALLWLLLMRLPIEQGTLLLLLCLVFMACIVLLGLPS
jgi:uncharacterized Fe-S radical SAM superfamily protein PflX